MGFLASLRQTNAIVHGNLLVLHPLPIRRWKLTVVLPKDRGQLALAISSLILSQLLALVGWLSFSLAKKRRLVFIVAATTQAALAWPAILSDPGIILDSIGRQIYEEESSGGFCEFCGAEQEDTTFHCDACDSCISKHDHVRK